MANVKPKPTEEFPQHLALAGALNSCIQSWCGPPFDELFCIMPESDCHSLPEHPLSKREVMGSNPIGGFFLVTD
eukprot:6458185-Amphidinium_carterae.1